MPPSFLSVTRQRNSCSQMCSLRYTFEKTGWQRSRDEKWQGANMVKLGFASNTHKKHPRTLLLFPLKISRPAPCLCISVASHVFVNVSHHYHSSGSSHFFFLPSLTFLLFTLLSFLPPTLIFLSPSPCPHLLGCHTRTPIYLLQSFSTVISNIPSLFKKTPVTPVSIYSFFPLSLHL